MGLSTWTDEEYARVARALRFPLNRRTTRIIGFAAATAQLGYALDAKLQQQDAIGKAYALELADRIIAAVRSRQETASGGDCDTQGILKVGDITFDRRQGQQLRADVIEEMRNELALAVDHYVNPRAAGMPGSGGGINGTCL